MSTTALLAEATSGHGHVVQFFEEDAALVPAVAGFLGARLAARGAAIVVASPERSRLIEDALHRRGVDVPAASAAGRYLEIDAGDLLGHFMRNGRPVRSLFEDAVRPYLVQVQAEKRPVAVYGEMVSILWEAGMPDAAMELEQHWNLLQRDLPFALFCGYRSADSQEESRFQQICLQHELVVEEPPAEVLADDHIRRWFEPTLYAAPAARRFTTATMRKWGMPRLMPSVELAVSELATNSIVHASTRFLVQIQRMATGIRVAVTDAGESLPSPAGSLDPEATRGRGIPLVGILAARWGTEIHEGGKTVWAEFDSAAAL